MADVPASVSLVVVDPPPVGLWPGDPAATINVTTGEISWLAVSPQEELQIGHYHLLKRNYAEAWRWYEQARQKLPAAKRPQNWTEFTQRVGSPENSQLFEFICLKRLGHGDEAAAKWLEFEQSFFPPTADKEIDGQTPDATDAMLKGLGTQAELLKHLIHDLYVAEVFLSVDAVDDALTHFRTEPQRPASDDEALSRAIVLAQLLLIARDYDGYLTQTTDVVRPLAIRMWKKSADHSQANENFVLTIATGLCLAPLFRPDFLSGVSDAALQQHIPTWSQGRELLSDTLPTVGVDLVLRAAALRREDEAEAKNAEERITRSLAGRELFAGKSIDEGIAAWFTASQLSFGSRPSRP